MPIIGGSIVAVSDTEIVPAIPVSRGARTLTAAELKGYLAALGDTGAEQLLRVALLAGGQRMAQLVRVAVSDFDADNGVLRLWDGKGKRAAAREHLLPLDPKARALVADLVAQRSTPADLICSVGERSAGNRAAEICDELKGAPFDLKDIRRTVETMLAAG